MRTAQLWSVVWFVLMLVSVGCSDDTSSNNGGDASVADSGMLDSGTVADVEIGGDTESIDAQIDDTTMRMTTIEVGDFVFDARVAGPRDGEPVLLLHGFPETSREWLAQIEALSAAGYHVVAPNQRGYSPGARPGAIEDYALPLLAQDVVGMADALGFEDFHLVGHDWGASVVWAVATTVPERLLSLTPISVPHLDAFSQVLGDETSCQYAASAYFDTFVSPGAEDSLLAGDGLFLRGIYGGLPQETIDFYTAFFLDRAALTGGLNWYRANIEDRQTKGPAIGQVTVPTMFIWSDGDTALCRDGAELTGDFVDGPYRFEVIEGVNHWVPELAAERVNALLLDHLGSYSR